MRTLSHLFDNNRAWASGITAKDPAFFEDMADSQSPEYLWIGCADSRVSAGQTVGLLPGQLFVHRNIANVVASTDLNCLSVIQYAVDVLKVEHIIVCGHYGCGGVKAALLGKRQGLIGNWLSHIVDVREKHREALAALPDEKHRWDRLCELNVIEQVAHVCKTTIVRDAWERRQPLAVHGWIYALETGLLRDMEICVTQADEFDSLHQATLDPGPDK